MDPNKKAPEITEAEPKELNTLDTETLEEVAGAGNPFDNIPRVPEQPIDDDLRDKG